jgi:heat shock protein HtpX
LAGLGALKRTMGFTIIIIFAIFLGLITIISFFFFDPVTAFVLGLAGGLFIMFLQYLIGPWIVGLTARLHYLAPGENRWLETKVGELANKSGIPMPRLAVSPDPTPNAFVFGRTRNSATLAVHQGLLQRLNEDEIEGVIGHELGHIKHRDFVVVTLISAIPLVAYLIARTVFWTGAASGYGGGRRGKSDNGAGLLIIAAIAAYAVYIVTTLLALRLTRLREQYADAYSAFLTSRPRELESALTKIAYGLSLSPEEPHGARAFFIEDPAQARQDVASIIDQKSKYDLDHDGVLSERELELAMEAEARSNWRKLTEAFATHPPVYKRILLLREIEQDINSGTFQQVNIYRHI